MKRNRRWSELSGGQRAAIVAGAAVELALTATALVDLARRPAEQVRGPKALWALGCVIQPVGPIAYLAVGRVGTRSR
ncbi:MAG: PLD nuclease N-terminal domain-containing protein [Microthrixaceae bacterium]